MTVETYQLLQSFARTTGGAKTKKTLTMIGNDDEFPLPTEGDMNALFMLCRSDHWGSVLHSIQRNKLLGTTKMVMDNHIVTTVMVSFKICQQSLESTIFLLLCADLFFFFLFIDSIKRLQVKEM